MLKNYLYLQVQKFIETSKIKLKDLKIKILF